jgi:hypothetical protein
MIKTLEEELKEARRLHKSARPRPRGRRPVARLLADDDD